MDVIAVVALIPLGAIRADGAGTAAENQPATNAVEERTPGLAGVIGDGENVGEVFSGIGVVKPNQIAQVSTAITGILSKLYGDVGEKVKTSHPVAEVDAGKYRL